jgi:hypothetical protein
MDDHNVIDIGLRVIKHCGIYTKEYRNCLLSEKAVPPIAKMINSFKEYWADGIALLNQTAVPALQHGYGMTAMDNDALVTLYGDLLANFGAMYAITQEIMKIQADSLVAMQNQIANIHKFCMAVDQQPPSSVYTPAQQQCMFTNHIKRSGGGQSNIHGFPQQPTMSFGGTRGGQQQTLRPPTPYKHWESQNYCHSHGGDVDDNHTSAMCDKPGPMHNPNASHTNIMSGLVAGMHKSSCPWLAATLRPIVTPSSSSTCSNIHPLPTTHLEAQPGSNRPLPCSMADRHWPAAPTASRQPWLCQFISPAKE